MFYVYLLAVGPHPSHLLKLRMPNRKPGFEGLICKTPRRVWTGPSDVVGKCVAESGPGAIITAVREIALCY